MQQQKDVTAMVPDSFFDRSGTLQQVCAGQSTAWMNPSLLPFEATDALCQLIVSDSDIADADARLRRFAPFLMKVFPETVPAGGLIESPLRPIPAMQEALERTFQCVIPGKLHVKLDSHLAAAGSVKARGGIYEVLKHAEDLAMGAGLLSPDEDYGKLAEPEMRDFFSGYTIQAGSTGNLGLSIGISGAALGFHVIIHMSSDARQWKKDLLRSRGVEVREYGGDYTAAVAEGRRLSGEDSRSYFVDDENSRTLFLGYAAAAGRLKTQLEEQKIKVDPDHPLFVYIPAGVGGAPGGIGYGLRRIFRDNVHLFFAEPVQCPSVLLGIASGRFEKACVTDFGLTGCTEADGLACPRPSGFVTRLMTPHLSGEFTVEDSTLREYLRLLDRSEHLRIEPSSCAAFQGPVRLLKEETVRHYTALHGLDARRLENSTQLVWATGGSLVPESVWQEYLG